MGIEAGAQPGVGTSRSTTNPQALTDTTHKKTNTEKWKDEDASVSWQKLNSAKVYGPDTTIHAFQRNQFTQSWYRDLGNLGAPVSNLLFSTEDRVGPSLGYHIFDVYRLNADSMNYYHASRPYAVFNFQLGSRLEQTAGIIHTQNVKPNLNFALEYRKVNAPGYFKFSRNNHDIFGLTSNYQSLDKHYLLNAAIVYNKMQHDENGGIVDESQLSDPAFVDRRTLNTAYENSQYSTTRSSVTNVQRDFTAMLQHSYRWGRKDTTYNSDSTQFTYKLIPRFSITHKVEISTEKHTYKDLTADSLRYITLFNHSFANKGTGYYTAGQDSVFNQQKWFWIDNQVLLNGFIGQAGRQLVFSAGLGNRYDQFVSTPVANAAKDSLNNTYYTIGTDRSSIISNYLIGEVKKEALDSSAWEYGARTKLFFTGADAGNFVLDASIGKQFSSVKGRFVAGFRQQLNTAPYSYTNYENNYTKSIFSFSTENVNLLYATLESAAWRLSGGVRNYLITNYIYLSDSEKPAQYTVPFSISQAWIRKVFKLGDFYIDNELVYQQVPDNAPVNIPALMARHQLSYEKATFKRRLKLVTGVEVRYNTAYHPAGYDALLNRFFYQKQLYVNNTPELSAFVNFRIKRFRAFVMVDNIQQLFAENTRLYAGTPAINYHQLGTDYNPIYTAPDVLIRFGFSWILVN